MSDAEIGQYQNKIELVLAKGMEDIKFEKDKYIYLPYSKVTMDNVENYLPEPAY